MNPYSLEAIVDRKTAEDRAWAARSRFAVEANQARRETPQPAESPLVPIGGRAMLRLIAVIALILSLTSVSLETAQGIAPDAFDFPVFYTYTG